MNFSKFSVTCRKSTLKYEKLHKNLLGLEQENVYNPMSWWWWKAMSGFKFDLQSLCTACAVHSATSLKLKAMHERLVKNGLGYYQRSSYKESPEPIYEMVNCMEQCYLFHMDSKSSSEIAAFPFPSVSVDSGLQSGTAELSSSHRAPSVFVEEEQKLEPRFDTPYSTPMYQPNESTGENDPLALTSDSRTLSEIHDAAGAAPPLPNFGSAFSFLPLDN